MNCESTALINSTPNNNDAPPVLILLITWKVLTLLKLAIEFTHVIYLNKCVIQQLQLIFHSSRRLPFLIKMEISHKKKQKQHAHPSQPRPKNKSVTHPFNIFKFVKDNTVWVSLLAVLFVACILKYFEDVHSSNSGFVDFGEDIYTLFGIPKNAIEADIKSRYRELSKKWHPDKNKDCPDCSDKFMKLKEAYKILLNPKLRKIYDRTNGLTVNIITSQTTDITAANYNTLVNGSDKVWMIQVFSDDWESCKSFSRHWEEAADTFSKFAEFGRINALLDPKVLRKLPIKVQIFPAVLMLFPDGGFNLFPQSSLTSSKQFYKYFRNVYPHSLNTYESYKSFKEKHDFKTPTLMIYSTAKPSIAAKYASLKYKYQMNIAYVNANTPFVENEHVKKDFSNTGEGALGLIRAWIEAMSDPTKNTALVLFDENGKITSLNVQPQDSLNKIMNNIQLMSQVAHEPMELVLETLDNVCMSTSSSDKFCVIVGSRYPKEKLEYSNILKRLLKYDTYANIDHIYKGQEESESASAIVQFAKTSPKNTTSGMRKLLCPHDECLLVLDYKRQKFCRIHHENKRVEFACEVDKEQKDYAWISDLVEGAFDTLQWHDFPAICKDKGFKSKCLASCKNWFSSYWNRVVMFW
ncbi:bifunctional Chaperone J-domain superfamily/DnaJ domain/Thioredoxin-like superfamily [Babesia duncani]|uniref:Bifunctional Chaperone J-domain superfamily/DnaJ domain/Thioredoxin-like superfamily n=1 Tax=Babesia duncani TaxID=323732 RepID=A0AAD9UN26_9APIC|nr:bifunctional Chaperone J-domain superfamily/DnaJ domain/Thioredoxin-like superfamily [Babesia duncani]